MRRELIVVALIPNLGTLPTNLWKVRNRFLNLIFASKIKLDRNLLHPALGGYHREFQSHRA